MTVQNLIVKNIASGNGSTTQWPFTFACPVDHPEYIKVYIKGSSGAATATTDFSVNMTTKYVTYPVTGSVLASGEKIIIARELPLHQILNLVNQGPFYAEDLEVTYDELVMMIQQLNEQLGRSLKVGIDIDQTREMDITVPVPTDNGNYGVRITKEGFSLTADPGEVYDETVAVKNQAEAAKTSAQNAASVAQGIANRFTNLDTAVNQCQNNANLALQRASEAAASASSANNSAELASGAKTSAEIAKNEAIIAKNNAAISASAASASVVEAKNYRDGAAAIVTPDGLAARVTANTDAISKIAKFYSYKDGSYSSGSSSYSGWYQNHVSISVQAGTYRLRVYGRDSISCRFGKAATLNGSDNVTGFNGNPCTEYAYVTITNEQAAQIRYLTLYFNSSGVQSYTWTLESGEGIVLYKEIPNMRADITTFENCLLKNMSTTIESAWQNGDVYEGRLTGNSARLFTSNILCYNDYITIYTDITKYYIRFVWYDANGNYVNDEGFITSKHYAQVPKDTKFRIVVRRVDGGDITTHEIFDSIKVVKNFKELPSYYFDNNYLPTKAQTVKEKGEEISAGCQFAFITDIHIGTNFLNSPMLLNYLQEHSTLNMCICGGDIPNAYGEESDIVYEKNHWVDFVRAINMPFLIAHGNHDWTKKTSANISEGFTKSKAFINYYSQQVMKNDANAKYVNNERYFYVDDTKNLVRYVIVDDYEGIRTSTTYWGIYDNISQKQFNWLIYDAFVVPSEEWSIVVFTHAGSNPSIPSYNANASLTLQHVLEAFRNKTYIYELCQYNGVIVDVNFSNYKGQFVAHICGHNHKDASNTLNGVLAISTTCDAAYVDDIWERNRGTIKEHAFDVFTLDKGNRKLYATRIGAGNDREWSY